MTGEDLDRQLTAILAAVERRDVDESMRLMDALPAANVDPSSVTRDQARKMFAIVKESTAALLESLAKLLDEGTAS